MEWKLSLWTWMKPICVGVPTVSAVAVGVVVIGKGLDCGFRIAVRVSPELDC